jgi:hypothetical protein
MLAHTRRIRDDCILAYDTSYGAYAVCTRGCGATNDTAFATNEDCILAYDTSFVAPQPRVHTAYAPYEVSYASMQSLAGCSRLRSDE